MSYTMRNTMLLIVLATFSSLTMAYQTMRIPNPLRYTFNAWLEKDSPRDNYTLPISASEFPCTGYTSDMFTDPTGIGRPVTTFGAGGPAHIILTGESLGGSGQISMSGNNGSLTVIHSFEGNVGTSDQQELDFTIPSDAPTGTVVLSFTYFPLGSNSVFQSCAAIQVDPAENATAPTIPFASRPDVFVSDLNNSCTRDPTKEVMFPNPGPDFTMNHTIPMANEVNTVIGTCLPVNDFGNGVKDNSTTSIKSTPFPAATKEDAPISVTQATIPATLAISSHYDLQTGIAGNGFTTFNASSIVSIQTAAPSPNKTTTLPYKSHTPGAPLRPPTSTTSPASRFPISQDGQCGWDKETKCPNDLCCSFYENCGLGADYCGKFTCVPGFGRCSKFDNGTLPGVANRTVAGRLMY